MVCRENPAGSLAIALARRGTWLDDAQLQSVFHRLSHEYHDAIPQGMGSDREHMINTALERHRAAIERDPVLGDDQRDALRRRLAAAEERRESCPDGVYWAVGRFAAGLAESQRALNGRLREIAGQRGMSMREARAEFFAQRAAMPAVGRGGNTAPSAEERADLGVMPTDGRTRYALAQMRAGEPVMTPRRLVDRVVAIYNPADGTAPATDPNRLVRVGWASGGNRLETYAADGTTRAYTVSTPNLDGLESVGSRMSPGHLQLVLAESEEIARADQTAWAARCDDCGQFSGARHVCEPTGINVDTFDQSATYTTSDAVLRHPPLTIMADHLRAAPSGEANVTIDAVLDGHHVQGQIGIRRGIDAVRPQDRGTRNIIDVDAVNDRLECTCMQAPHCSHAVQATEMLRTTIARSLVSESRTAAIDELIVTPAPAGASPVTVTDRALSASTPGAAGASLSFADDPNTFRDLILGSGTARTVPFFDGDSGPVLTGYSAGVQFGIEIEFGATNNAATDVATQRLVNHGILTPARGHRVGYHTAQRTGWNSWVLENDCSITGAELVTPVMHDDPHNWRQLSSACDALALDTVYTHEAGSHTNISAQDYTPEMAYRLAHLFRTHEDDICRMGRTRGSRRNAHYNTSLPDPGPTWTQASTYYHQGYHRQAMVNFTHLHTGGAPRIEFRFPDASLNAGVIQAQVRLCSALTNYVRDNGVDTTATPRPRGTSHAEGWTRQLMSSAMSASDFARHTQSVRSLIDTLFDTNEARHQIATLWGRGAYR